MPLSSVKLGRGAGALGAARARGSRSSGSAVGSGTAVLARRNCRASDPCEAQQHDARGAGEQLALLLVHLVRLAQEHAAALIHRALPRADLAVAPGWLAGSRSAPR